MQLRHVSDAFVEDPLRVLRVARFAARFAHLGFTVADDTLALIGRRERKSHNSWMHNNRYIRHRQENEALLHPNDAQARGKWNPSVTRMIRSALCNSVMLNSAFCNVD